MLSFRLSSLQSGQKGASLPSPHNTTPVSQTFAISCFLAGRFSARATQGAGRVTGNPLLLVLGQPEPGSDLKGQAAPPQALGLEQKENCCGAALSPRLPARSVTKASASRGGGHGAP